MDEEEQRSIADVGTASDAEGLTCRDMVADVKPQEASTVSSGASSSSDSNKALDLCEHVRRLLAKELQPIPATFACPLSCEYPLTESGRGGYHGFCDIEVHSWTAEGHGCRKASSFTVRSVSLQLRNPQGELLPVELLLPTFIHELAHTVTCPEMRRAEMVSSTLLKLQPNATEPSKDGFLPVHHPESFYTNFAELLRVAERLDIYKLPVTPNKFAAKSLMRFDSIDPAASLDKLNVGQSPLFATAFGATLPDLRVLITDAKRVKQKTLVLKQRTVAEVLAESKQRLNLRRKPTLVTDASGRVLHDELLASLKTDDLLIVT